MIDDYNLNMNGVDISDHLRSMYKTQLGVHRNWLCLFFWLLDTTIINSYLLSRWHYEQQNLSKAELRNLQPAHDSHKDYRKSLVVVLCKHAEEQSSRSYVSQFHSPHRVQAPAGDDTTHEPIQNDNLRRCYWCRIQHKAKLKVRIQRSKFVCSSCNAVLCKVGCFDEYHSSEITETMPPEPASEL